MPISQSLIEVKNISFNYGNNVILDDVSFNIDKGDYVGILGPNGGGKSTLLKILIGLLKPQSGSVSILGVPIADFKNNGRIGYVPQRIAQDTANFPATVYEIVESGRIAAKGLFGGVSSEDREKIKKALFVAGIEGLKDQLIANLSGGQRQRVYVARSLANEPKILILDEPFTGVDIGAQKDFYAFLKELNQAKGLTIIFVSHDIDVISKEIKSVICLNRRLVCFGLPEILHKHNIIEDLYGKKITHIHHSH